MRFERRLQQLFIFKAGAAGIGRHLEAFQKPKSDPEAEVMRQRALRRQVEGLITAC
jgi:hypothetical protein